MVDNMLRYGFRAYTTLAGKAMPPTREITIATAQEFDVTGLVQNASLRAGDVITRLNTGTATFCAGNETTPALPLGVVADVIQVLDTRTGQPGFSRVVPSAVAWGTNEQNRTRISYYPIESCVWEVDCDDAVTATTIAAYRLLIGLNVSMINTGPTVGTNPRLEIRPKLDISTADTTNTLIFRIVGISESQHNIDASGANFKLLVVSNLSQETAILGV